MLNEGERSLVLVTHDESCFGSKDGRSFVWINEDKREIRPKGNGRSIMVSAFLCECQGLLRLSVNQQAHSHDIPADSTVLLKSRANAESYWRNSDLV